MSLKDYSKEDLKIKPMVEIAGFILQDAKKALTFQEIYDQIAEIKGLTKKAKEEKIAQFYTELNVDGRFMTLGSNVWGLKVWYPVDQADEEITAPPKKKTKAKKKAEDDDDDFELEEDLGVKELGEEDLEDDDDDDDEDEDTGFVALEEDLDVEEEDLEEEISDEGDEINEDEEE